MNGRRKNDGIKAKILLAFELATLLLSIYALRAIKNAGDVLRDMDRESEIKQQILAAKLESSQGCSLDRKGGM